MTSVVIRSVYVEYFALLHLYFFMMSCYISCVLFEFHFVLKATFRAVSISVFISYFELYYVTIHLTCLLFVNRVYASSDNTVECGFSLIKQSSCANSCSLIVLIFLKETIVSLLLLLLQVPGLQ